MKKQIFTKELLPALTSVLLLNLGANLLRLYRYSYDAYTHIFFASHYMRDWFNLWETRWYCGFPVTSYPPLVHQLTALLGFLLGLEVSYQIICIVAAVLLVFSLYKASSMFIDKAEAKHVALTASLLPSLYLTLYVYGQLPTIFASALSFLCAYSFYNFLLTGKKEDLAYTTISATLTIAAHHFTFFFFLPLILILAVLMSMIKGGVSPKKILGRLVIAFAFSAVTILVIMYPFFEFLMNAPPQVEIPHASRGNIFSDIHSLLFFWGVYGFTVILFPIAFPITRKRKELIPLLVVFLSLFIMGLGGLTPIPQLVLGELWHVLTYDRFAVWASFLFTVFLGIILKDAGQISEKYYGKSFPSVLKTSRNGLKIWLIIGLILSTVFTMCLDSFVTPRPAPDPALTKIAEFLENGGNYRYITFGLNQGFMKLTIICTKQAVDGGYNAARRIRVLMDSGVERIDTAIYFPNRTDFLDALLNQSDELGIKWAIVNADMDPNHLNFYVRKLKKHGYALHETLYRNETSGLKIEIWINKDIIPIKENNSHEKFTISETVAWGCGPILFLISSLFLFAWKTASSKLSSVNTGITVPPQLC